MRGSNVFPYYNSTSEHDKKKLENGIQMSDWCNYRMSMTFQYSTSLNISTTISHSNI